MAQISHLKYDCRVFLCKYNRQPVKFKIYEDVYYEIIKGLKSVNVTLSRTGMGTANVVIFLPLNNQSNHKEYNSNNILLKYDRGKKEEKVKTVTRDDFLKYRERLIKLYPSKKVNEIIDRTFRFEINGKKVSSPTGYEEFLKIQVVTETGGDWGVLTDSTTKMNPSSKREDIFKDKQGNPFIFKYEPILNDDFTECVFQPMDKIKIYMSNRFQGDTINDENIDKIEIEKYSQVFEGLINNVNINYNNGTISITISAKDITRWLEISQFNLNPAIASNKLPAIFENMGVKVYATAFAEFSLNEIVEMLIVGSEDKWAEITRQEYLNAVSAAKKEGTYSSVKDNFRTETLEQQRVVNNEETYKAVRSRTISNLSKKITIDNDLLTKYKIKSKQSMTLRDVDRIISKEKLENGEKLSKYRNQIILSEDKIKELEVQETKDVTKYYKRIPGLKGAGNFSLQKKDEGIAPGESAGLDTIRLETDFSRDKLWIDPTIPKFIPYRSIFNQFQLFNHDRRPRLDIIKEITAINELEFYMDSTGILVCKVPDYNLNPGTELFKYSQETSSSSKPSLSYSRSSPELEFKMSDDTFLIKPQEIISYNKTLSDDIIKTYCILTGEYRYEINEVALVNTDIAFDPSLAKRFGVRIIQKKVPLITGSDKKEVRELLAKSWLNRINSKWKTINVSIPLRPEIQLAKTVAFLSDKIKINTRTNSDIVEYLNEIESQIKSTSQDSDKDKINNNKEILDSIEVGYVSGITHSWSVGNLCTTRLTLTHVRRWRQTFGTLAYKRSNFSPSVFKEKSVTLNYRALESKIIDKKNLRKQAYIKHQKWLAKKGYYKGTANGEVTNSDRAAVNDFLKKHNEDFPDKQIRAVRSDENPYERTDILEAFIWSK